MIINKNDVLDDIHKFLPCLVKPQCSLKCPERLCTSTLKQWFFYLFTLANKQNTLISWWSGKWYKWWIESNEQLCVNFCSVPNHWVNTCL